MLDEIGGNPVTTSQESGKRKPFAMSGRKRALEKKRKRRKVLPGFPWKGQFRTKEEIDAYFAGDKIQCLLCGKRYKKLSGSHLSCIHDMEDDEYRQRYGLPWSRGLIGGAFRERRSEITKQLIKEGRIHALDENDGQIRQKIRETPRRPPQPFHQNLSKKHILAVYGRTTIWQREDYEAILTRMQEQQRSLSNVLQDPDLPGEKAWRNFVKKHPDFAAKAQQIHFSLPYSKQFQTRNVSPQFRIDCQRLRSQGKTLQEIANILGVSCKTVRRTLPGTKPVRKRLTLNEMRQLAERRGGKCLSEIYINNKTKLLWQCEQGHQWASEPSTIKSGHWCPYCAGSIKGTLEDMQRIANCRGGKCLSETYIDNRTKLLWECKQGHQWAAMPGMIKQGQWCPYCAGVAKGTLEEMQQLAKRRGGTCLSETYINRHTKLLWECRQGHQWKAKPHAIINRHWCPYCAGNMKKSIDDMHQLAERRGGRCLSTIYTNGRTKLVWQCEQGHQWKARPSNIKKGHWCPYCARRKKRPRSHK